MSKAKKRLIEAYPLERSPFWRMGRQRDIAEALCIQPSALKRLLRRRYEHYFYKEEVINGKARSIQCPTGGMRRAHERLNQLFNRIEKPAYVASPRHGQSAISNAKRHAAGREFVKLDIRQFYPSTTNEHVYQFFRYGCQMRDDVAGAMTLLCTIDGHLAFGSPLSPVLCTFVQRDMFDAIGAAVEGVDTAYSVYVDDIQFSGDVVPEALIFEAKRAIRARGLDYHKIGRGSSRRGFTVTGCRIKGGGLSPANKTHLKMEGMLGALDEAEKGEERLRLIRSLIGLNNHMQTAYSEGHAAGSRLKSMLAWLHRERRELERDDRARLRRY